MAEKKKQLPKKKSTKKKIDKENKQAIWIIVGIAVVFMSFLIPYIYSNRDTSFQYSNINWTIEEYGDLAIYHGRFPAILTDGVIFNMYLREDPRENDVETVGSFSSLKSTSGVFISFDEETYSCTGQLSRAMLDLGSFLNKGVGIDQVYTGTTSLYIKVKENVTYIDCDTISARTVIIIEKGNESKVVQDEDNKGCYTIYVTDCDDFSSVEKFMTEMTNGLITKKENYYASLNYESSNNSVSSD
jgi:hypothetical protein